MKVLVADSAPKRMCVAFHWLVGCVCGVWDCLYGCKTALSRPTGKCEGGDEDVRSGRRLVARGGD